MDLDAYTMDWLDGQVQAPPKDAPDRESTDIYQASIHSIANVFLALGRAGGLFTSRKEVEAGYGL